MATKKPLASEKHSPKAPHHNHHSNNPLSGTLAPTRYTGQRRDGLLEYIKEPVDNPRVIYFTDDWVLIKDMYPKSSVHFLLLPRKQGFYRQHPFRAFKDTTLLSQAREEVAKAVSIAASELRRLYGSYSTKEAPRVQAMMLDDPPDELPKGRDWEQDVKIGVHAYPSMNHLHIHIISVDRHSSSMKHAKHYNTFNTPFFVPLDDFPLGENDDRWVSEKLQEYTSGDLICWRCGRNYKRSFARLKEHLEEEFIQWRQE
jgi:aprataxin